MRKEKRFGRRITEPSSVQIIHELKLMTMRQSLNAAMAREAEAAEQASSKASHEISTVASAQT